jgi:two-component system NarL family response regulator
LLREFARQAGQTQQGERSPEPASRVVGGAGQAGGAPSRESRDSLTERQAEVLQLVASGLTYKEVGVRLALSERTVRYHMGEIMQKLHLENRSQVIAYAGRLSQEILK